MALPLPVFTAEQIVNAIQTSWSAPNNGSTLAWASKQITYELGIQSGPFTLDSEGSGYVPMSADQTTFARQAFALWAEVADIKLTEKTFSDPTLANITFAYSSTTDSDGT